LLPTGETIPRPVTTTRRLDKISLYMQLQKTTVVNDTVNHAMILYFMDESK